VWADFCACTSEQSFLERQFVLCKVLNFTLSPYSSQSQHHAACAAAAGYVRPTGSGSPFSASRLSGPERGADQGGAKWARVLPRGRFFSAAREKLFQSERAKMPPASLCPFA